MGNPFCFLELIATDMLSEQRQSRPSDRRYPPDTMFDDIQVRVYIIMIMLGNAIDITLLACSKHQKPKRIVYFEFARNMNANGSQTKKLGPKT